MEPNDDDASTKLPSNVISRHCQLINPQLILLQMTFNPEASYGLLFHSTIPVVLKAGTSPTSDISIVARRQ